MALLRNAVSVANQDGSDSRGASLETVSMTDLG